METHAINKFSFKRLYSYIKDLLQCNKQSIFFSIIILYSLKVIPYILNVLTTNNTGINFFKMVNKNDSSTFSISIKLIIFFAIVLMSIHFSRYKEGTFFQRSFVLPVKMSEKFISLLVIYILLIPFFLYLTDVAAICTKYLVAHNQNSILNLSMFGGNSNNVSFKFNLFSSLKYLMTLLFFFTGFIIYKKHSIIKTILTILGFSIGIMIIMAIMAIIANIYIGSIELLLNKTFISTSENLSFYSNNITAIVTLLIASFLLFIGWKKFKNYV